VRGRKKELKIVWERERMCVGWVERIRKGGERGRGKEWRDGERGEKE
jgi:hypothetical protein